jgi:hypothetical protein
MNCCRLCFPLVAIVGAVILTTSISVAQSGKDTKPATKPTTTAPAGAQEGMGDMELPPGMTPEDMEAMMAAATPGKMHAWLQEGVGEWTGTCKMWMDPESAPTESKCTATIKSMMDGRFTTCEVKGDMGGMPFTGFGIYGFDNVSGKFQHTWVDNMGTGMMNGTGDLSADGKTLTWNCTFNCPIAKGPIKMREIERRTGKDSYVLEMHGTHPGMDKEMKIMEINFTRKGGTASASATSGH